MSFVRLAKRLGLLFQRFGVPSDFICQRHVIQLAQLGFQMGAMFLQALFQCGFLIVGDGAEIGFGLLEYFQPVFVAVDAVPAALLERSQATADVLDVLRPLLLSVQGIDQVVQQFLQFG